MKNIEEIPKNNFFQVPPAYFETLPLRIQERLERKAPVQQRQALFRLAIAAAVVIAVSVCLYFTAGRPSENAESMLADVETAELILYLQESEVTTEEVLENVTFSADDIDALEDAVYEMYSPETREDFEELP